MLTLSTLQRRLLQSTEILPCSLVIIFGSREKEVKRKQKKNIKRFNKFLKSLKEVKADSQYKTFEARIKEQGPSSFPLLTEEEYPKLFEAYTKELKVLYIVRVGAN